MGIHQTYIKTYYILMNEKLRNIDEIKCVFSFSEFSLKNIIFHVCETYIRIFTGVLSDFCFLNSACTQNLRESLSNCNVKTDNYVYNKQKIQDFILWYENYHISQVATATHEIFIFIPLNENKSCTYR
jgi:hypothetical protein